MYELEFMGLRPALAVKAHVDMKRVYEQFKLGVNFGVRAGGGTGTGTTATPPPPTPTATPTTTGTTTPPATPPATPHTTPPATPPANPATPTATTPAASGAGTQVFLSADIGYTMEKLKQSGAIKLEIVRQQEGASVDQMEKAALDLLKETLLKDFFSPAMTAAPAMTPATAVATAQTMMASTQQTNQGTAGGGTRVELGFQLQWKKEEQLKEADFDYTVISPEKRTHSPNGFFSALLTGTEKKQLIRDINLDDPFFKTLDVDVNTTADFPLFDLKDIVVELQYGGTPPSPRVAGTAHFKPTETNPRHFIATRDDDDFTYRYRTQYSFGQSERIAAQKQAYETPWRTSMKRTLVVHPPSDVSMLRVFVEPGVVDWELIEQIETRLTYHDEANAFHTERTFIVKQASTVQEWIVRLTNPELNTYTVQHTWHLKDRSELAGKPTTTDVAHLFVGDPFVDRLPVSIQVVDGANLARVMVELLYTDPANRLDIRKNVEMEGPVFGTKTVTIPIMDVRRREYTYRVVLVKTNGGDETWPDKTTDRLPIIITEGYVKFEVSILLVGDLAQNGLDALQLELRGEPLAGDPVRVESILFDQTSEKKVKEPLRLRADRVPKFQYRTSAFRTVGDPLISDWLDHASENLVIQLNRLIPR
jgi:hypothetical protein